MIYTITFNPSLDYIIEVDHFKAGQINKTKAELILPGGKGINVSIVASNLGYTSTAIGFTAGFTGKEIERRILDYGCKSSFIHVEEGLSRINVKMKSDEETEINGMGPKITKANVQELFDKLDDLHSDDILVMSGSVPDSLPSDIYEQIIEHIQDKQVEVVVDTTKDLLLNTLKYHPFLIKPNNLELGEIFHVDIQTKEDVVVYAKRLQALGARNVLISMAGKGAVLVDENQKIHQTEAPKGTVVNSVGAGDSMVAGFVTGYLSSHDYEKAFYQGVCAGSASAFSKTLCTKSEVEDLLKTL